MFPCYPLIYLHFARAPILPTHVHQSCVYCDALFLNTTSNLLWAYSTNVFSKDKEDEMFVKKYSDLSSVANTTNETFVFILDYSYLVFPCLPSLCSGM